MQWSVLECMYCTTCALPKVLPARGQEDEIRFNSRVSNTQRSSVVWNEGRF